MSAKAARGKRSTGRLASPAGSERGGGNGKRPRGGDGKLQGVFAAARDVTERKRFEEELQRTNFQLEKANFAKDRFLASMSHELRTPLNAIIGFTGTMLMELPGKLNGEQAKQLQTVDANAKHLLSIINDLLDLTKIESGKVELSLRPVACQDIVGEVMSSLESLAAKKGIELTATECDSELVVRTDRRALTQILINLTSNAIKFTDAGSVALTVGREVVDGKHWTRFQIADTGIGIKPADQAKLFVAFRQIEPSATRRYEGTGLGLYISEKLATLLNGRISCESEYGKGSVFTLELEEEL